MFGEEDVTYAYICINHAPSKIPEVLELHETNNGLFWGDLFRAVPGAYGGSQTRGGIAAVAAGLHHSRSKVGSEHICDTPQLTGMPDP